MSKHKSDDHRVNYGEPADREAEQLLAEQAALEQQAAITPGTNGDPNDSMDDFPTLRDAGEPWAKAATGQSLPDEGWKARFDDLAPALEVRDAGDDTAKPPPRRWLMGNQFCRGFLSGLVAPGSTGKSALRMLQCLSLATGVSLTDQHIFRRCRVLIVSFEDDQQEIQRRILAAMLEYGKYGITREQVKGWLFYACPKGIKLAEMKNGSRQIGALEKQLRVWIEKYRPDLVVLDPYVKVHALEENDNSAMDFVCDLLATLAIEYDIAIDAPHHTRKGQLTPGDADSGRGGSAVRDAGRLIYTLTAMNEEEANQFGINPEDRAAYVRLDKAKVNLTPPARTAEWFKLVGVKLDNGNDEYPNGDEVQTVKPWKPPKLWEGLASETLNAALTDIDNGMPNGQRYTDAGGGKGPRARPGRWCRSTAPAGPKASAARSFEHGSKTACSMRPNMTTRSSASGAKAIGSIPARGRHNA